MNKKILIGSIGAVIIIVLATFTSVVGVQTNDNSIKMTSPLFGVRTQSAIRANDDVLTTANYVGEGKTFLISNLNINKERYLVNNFLDKIEKMNKKTFENFVNLIIQQLYLNKVITNDDEGKIRSGLWYIKENSEQIKIDAANNADSVENNRMRTEEFTCTCTGHPLCPLFMLIGTIILGIILLIVVIACIFDAINNHNLNPTS